MNTSRLQFLGLILILSGLMACSTPESGHHEDAHGHGHEEAETEFERGPNRGRMLRQDDFAIEVTIFETGVPPQFRLYAYVKDRPVPATEVKATIALGRLGGITDTFQFKPEGLYLVGNATVVEPHSFDVEVTASHGGRNFAWRYESYEGRTSIPSAIAKEAGVTVERAGPVMLREPLALMGQVALNGDRYAEVRARFAGPVQNVHVNIGDSVRRGQTLATIENSDTLVSYALTSPIEGVVLARHTNAGDVAGTNPLFEIADLSVLWLELHAFGEDAGRLRAGQSVRLASGQGGATTTELQRVLPLASSASQSVVARALLPNPEGQWRPGMAVKAEVILGEREVPLAVRLPALQRFRDFTVVFARFGDTYEVRMLELGQRDGEFVEVLDGLTAGSEYVVEQSFLIKADIEKSGASHDH
ncbi:MAG: efflux RND transporter periplasmic adaptor subunit [Ahniella sp.]|nr:efflux RND transporter periplasmic adaptor subunit [Ahniella sp.]